MLRKIENPRPVLMKEGLSRLADLAEERNDLDAAARYREELESTRETLR